MGVTGKSAPLISGLAKNLFEDEDDMIALRTPAASDPLSKLLQDSWVFQERFRDSFDHTSRYQGRHVAWTVAIISMLCAAGLLAVAIVSLYLVSNPTAKLGMVVAYTIIFALSIALLTNASRAEIYGASAAYAAVLVVFISGNVGGTQSEQCLIQLGNGVFKTVDCPN
ncbi:uncharacterized protein N7459_006988 [Penicillium hispanicum]|uniref:uncharacterized protein n=1 Tax=Penicillium hispanicum TaxID=1080232 RepID=UPI00254206BF|nr:uncharacterized protein N7459_006988 [Penicillium hispanicum]KAJ5578024.1 hypothetical protein N7459_006988 [Penicillium hispanicum]